MAAQEISAQDPHNRRTADVLESTMAYVDEGSGDAIVFIHGNPTSSYLWRNVIPHLAGQGRCLAPDLIGMGGSGPADGGSYTYADHSRYLDAWFEAAGVGDNVVLVLHDWGGGLGLDWAYRNQERVQGIAYMETLVGPMTFDDLAEPARSLFKALRSPAGEEMVLEKNMFVEQLLPGAVLRGLTEAEMDIYRAPFAEPGACRQPTLTWPRMIPFDGEPADVSARIDAYGKWMAENDIPKLFVNADPGAILNGRLEALCRSWPNQTEVTVAGAHFIQEDSPHEIGEAVSAFVRKLRG